MKIVKTASKSGGFFLPILVVTLLVGFYLFSAPSINASVKPVELSAQTNQQRLSFLKAQNISCDFEPCELREIIIPLDFSGIFSEYAALQKTQGFDLELLKGQTVRRYCYEIKGKQEAQLAELLAKDGQIVGAAVINLEAGTVSPLCK